MDEGLIVLRTDGAVQAFDRGAERLLGLDPGMLRVDSMLGSLIGVELLDRLLEAAPHCDDEEVLGSGELSFELGEVWLRASATRLSASVSSEPTVLVRLRYCGSAELGADRDLAARLSRELRAPVTAIRGCSETLLGGALDEVERARRFVEMVGHNVDSLELLADDLSSFAQIHPEWIRANRRAVDVRPVLGATARSHAGAIIRRGVVVRAAPVADPVLVAAVPELFERSLRGVVGELVRVAKRGEEITCTAACPVPSSGEGRALAEISVHRVSDGDSVGASAGAADTSSSSLRMETVRDVVHCHGGWLATSRVQGHVDTIKLFWPLWEAPCAGSA